MASLAGRIAHPHRTGPGRSRPSRGLGGRMANPLGVSAPLIPARPLLTFVLDRVGHGELLVRFAAARPGRCGGIELVGLKGDLGALVLGVVLARHHKAEEVARTMFGLKNLFLLGFFLSIGLSGPLTLEAFLVGAAITPLVEVGAVLRSVHESCGRGPRCALPCANYSEFGLIVAALGVDGWLDARWLIVLAIALSFSCAAAVLNAAAHRIYHGTAWRGRILNGLSTSLMNGRSTSEERGAILGMGRIGTAAYDHMHRRHDGAVVGVDFDPQRVRHHQSAGRRVLLGDPRDGDFWDRVQSAQSLDLVSFAESRRQTRRSGPHQRLRFPGPDRRRSQVPG